VSRSIFESREGEGREPAVRRASSQRNPRRAPATRVPTRGAGGPQTFGGVLPGSEDRAARHRAPAHTFDVRRGVPAPSGRSAHRLPINHTVTAREAGAKEEKK